MTRSSAPEMTIEVVANSRHTDPLLAAHVRRKKPQGSRRTVALTSESIDRLDMLAKHYQAASRIEMLKALIESNYQSAFHTQAAAIEG